MSVNLNNTRREILFVEDVHLSCISLGTQRYESYATLVAWAIRKALSNRKFVVRNFIGCRRRGMFRDGHIYFFLGQLAALYRYILGSAPSSAPVGRRHEHQQRNIHRMRRGSGGQATECAPGSIYFLHVGLRVALTVHPCDLEAKEVAHAATPTRGVPNVTHATSGSERRPRRETEPQAS